MFEITAGKNMLVPVDLLSAPTQRYVQRLQYERKGVMLVLIIAISN